MRKALIIATEALEYIRTQLPEDDPRFGVGLNQFKVSIGHLNRMAEDLEHERHEWSVKNLGADKCPCVKCEDDQKVMDKCVREAVAEEISQCVEVQLPSVKSYTEEIPSNTSATEIPASCDA